MHGVSLEHARPLHVLGANASSHTVLGEISEKVQTSFIEA
jgi:hypothetical protein